MNEVTENSFMQDIKLIKKAQATVDILLKEKLVVSTAERTSVESRGKWALESLFDGEKCNIGFAHCDTIDSSDFPSHVHEDVVEYLICISGSVLETFNGSGLRVLKAGECISVPKGVIHRSKALEPNTTLVYVCVPADKNFSLLGKQLPESDK